MSQNSYVTQNYLLVTAALIIREDRIFIAQRPPGKAFGLYWEFPGGKAEPGESLEDCLFREIREELSLEIQIGDLFQNVRYRHRNLNIDLYAYWCAISGGELLLREHVACYWASPDELKDYRFTRADQQVVACIERLHRLPDSCALTKSS